MCNCVLVHFLPETNTPLPSLRTRISAASPLPLTPLDTSGCDAAWRDVRLPLWWAAVTGSWFPCAAETAATAVAVCIWLVGRAVRAWSARRRRGCVVPVIVRPEVVDNDLRVC